VVAGDEFQLALRRRAVQQCAQREGITRVRPKVRLLLAACSVVILLVAACGPGAHSAATPSAPIATGSPQPVPSGAASGPREQSPSPIAALKPCGVLPSASQSASSPALVLGRLSGSTNWVVRDVTDIGNPATLASLGDKWQWADKTAGGALDARLVDPSTLVWADWSTPQGNLVESATNGSGQRTLVSGSTYNAIASFAWSPVNSDRTYLLNTTSALEWHLVTGGADRLLASPPYIPAIGGRPRLTPIMVGFSGDGRFVAMTDYLVGGTAGSGGSAKFQIRKSDGTLMATGTTIVPASSFISDLLWVGSSLYFRDDNGIEVWTESGACSALPGVQWIRPKLSPDARQIVFHTEDTNQLAHVSLYDLATRNVRQISPAAGAEAWFLGSRYVWFLEERLCGAGESCGVSSATFTGKAYIVDLQTGISSQSRITRIADTWPRPGQPNFDNIWWMDAAAYQ
jgi:hypothetical protein